MKFAGGQEQQEEQPGLGRNVESCIGTCSEACVGQDWRETLVGHAYRIYRKKALCYGGDWHIWKKTLSFL
jgi:hypothetical protein